MVGGGAGVVVILPTPQHVCVCWGALLGPWLDSRRSGGRCVRLCGVLRGVRSPPFILTAMGPCLPVALPRGAGNALLHDGTAHSTHIIMGHQIKGVRLNGGWLQTADGASPC